MFDTATKPNPDGASATPGEVAGGCGLASEEWGRG